MLQLNKTAAKDIYFIAALYFILALSFILFYMRGRRL